MTKRNRKYALNSGDLLGGLARHDAHVVTHILRAVTIIFWADGAQDSRGEWSRAQPEVSDADMIAAASKGRPGTVRIYRGQSDVNSLFSKPSLQARAA